MKAFIWIILTFAKRNASVGRPEHISFLHSRFRCMICHEIKNQWLTVEAAHFRVVSLWCVWMMGFVSGNKQLDHASPHSGHTSSGCILSCTLQSRWIDDELNCRQQHKISARWIGFIRHLVKIWWRFCAGSSRGWNVDVHTFDGWHAQFCHCFTIVRSIQSFENYSK